MIRVYRLSYRYPGASNLALEGIDLQIHEGEGVVVTGKTGAGKSTLIYALNGLIPHVLGGEREGAVEVEGIDPALVSVKEMAQQVGIVFQNPEHQIFMLRVWDDVAFGCINRGYPEAMVEGRVKEALDLMGLSELKSREIFKLSGGQKQRLAIAGSYAVGPKVFLFEEPLTDLDEQGRSSFLDMIGTLKARGHTLIIAEHQVEAFTSWADRIICLEQGRIAWEEQRPFSFHPFLPPGEREAHPIQPPAPLPVQMQGVDVTFKDGTFGLRNIYLSFQKGELAAVCGPNGSGKTTLLKAIMGILPVAQGKIEVLGKKANFKQLVGQVVYLFQNPDDQLFAESVEEELAFGPRNLGKNGTNVEAYLDLFQLRDLRKRHPLTLSRGERQRLAVASLLIMEPQILLLDEPTTGLDRSNWMQLMEGVETMHHRGITVLFTSHHKEVVDRYAHRLIRLEQGEVVNDQVL
jgi:energy-coupling factor transporter ATP-binding protein EcfA2